MKVPRPLTGEMQKALRRRIVQRWLIDRERETTAGELVIRTRIARITADNLRGTRSWEAVLLRAQVTEGNQLVSVKAE